MVEILWKGSPRLRFFALLGCLLIGFQWWFVPTMDPEWTGKWLWSLSPAHDFPAWFRALFPLFLLFFPFHRCLPSSRFIRSKKVHLFLGLSVALGGGLLFWAFRVGPLVLGDAQLISDHFTGLQIYASVREPLESVFHTEFCRFLFFNWGIHPMTGFRILSCLYGVFALWLAWRGLSQISDKEGTLACWTLFLFLVGPVHLFFGYIEWYTQMALGLIVFQVYSLLYWRKGRGLWVAVGGLVFACGSHLVSFSFVPAAIALVLLNGPREGRLKRLAGLVAFLAIGVGLAIFLVKRHIAFSASVEATSNLFHTLLPFMREDNPNNPPGSWTYAWLSKNHLTDLANELLLCGFFPIMVVCGTWLSRGRSGEGATGSHDVAGPESEAGSSGAWGIQVFFGLQIAASGLFLLIWNPWLGFPADWDLFSFFAWPSLAGALLYLRSALSPPLRRRVLTAAGFPAFSLVTAWVVHYHGGLPERLPDWIASRDENYYDRLLEEANHHTDIGEWPRAFEEVERVMRAYPEKTALCFEVFSPAKLQAMSFEWPGREKITPLAVDCEIMAASPVQRLLVLDCWGRLFFWEGGYFNDWAPSGLPGIPDTRAVDFEILPWREAAVVLLDNGDLYEIPISSWVDLNPQTSRQTHFLDPPVDRSPKPLGNFYTDHSKATLGRGQLAVDLGLDHWNKKMVVLDTTGRLVIEGGTDEISEEERPPALIRRDIEVNYNGERFFVCDHFGEITEWPGGTHPIGLLPDYGWPAISDMEIGRGGVDYYLLDGQGGISAHSVIGDAPIDPANLRHYAPTGEPLASSPYSTDPFTFFIDLELVPFEKAYYRMTRNFRIHYSEAPAE